MDEDKHMQAEENNKLLSMDLTKHRIVTVEREWYVQNPWLPLALVPVCYGVMMLLKRIQEPYLNHRE